MNFIRKVLETFKMQIKLNLAYAGSAWASVIIGIIQIVVFYYIWMAVYGANNVINGISKAQIVTYIIISRIISAHVAWGVNRMISFLIISGDISIAMLRPIDFQTYMFSTRMGDFSAVLVQQSAPALIFSAIVFGISPPAGAAAGLFFFVSFIFSILITYLFEYFIASLTFYTNNEFGLQVLKNALVSFLSGALVPLPFFPTLLREIVSFLPFKDMVYTPISIYLGIASGSQIIVLILSQLFWIAALLIISRLFFRYSLRKVTVQGG